MPVVKKTVSIAPEIDRWIRNLWAALVVKGYDVGYSTALNLLIAMGIYQSLIDFGAKEYAERFLQKVLESIGDIEVTESIDKVFKWFADVLLQIAKSISDESKKGSA
jgi:hypothetical protein